MFCLSLCSSAISFLSQQSCCAGLHLTAQNLFHFPTFLLLISVFRPAHPSGPLTSQLFNEFVSSSLTPPIFHTVFSKFMLIYNQVLLFLSPLLVQPQSFFFISPIAFQAQMQFSIISTLFVTYFFFLWERFFSPHRVISVYLPGYQGLGLPDVHLCACVHPPRLSALGCVLRRDGVNADLSPVQAPRWQNMIKSSLMMEHELSDQHYHEQGHGNMSHEHEDFIF